MPFTPFHLGPALLVGLLCYRWLDLPTLLAASIAVDVRATLVFFGLLGRPIHGPVHTLVGATALGLTIAVVWYSLRPHFTPVLAVFHLAQDRSWRAIAGAALVGAWSHVVLDGVLYADMNPLAPVTTLNPFFWPLDTATPLAYVYGGCVVLGVLGVLLYLLSVTFPESRVTVSLSSPPVE